MTFPGGSFTTRHGLPVNMLCPLHTAWLALRQRSTWGWSQHLNSSTLRMVVSLNIVSLIIICLGELATSVSVRDTIITSLVAPQDITVTSDQVNRPVQDYLFMFMFDSGYIWDWWWQMLVRISILNNIMSTGELTEIYTENNQLYLRLFRLDSVISSVIKISRGTPVHIVFIRQDHIIYFCN